MHNLLPILQIAVPSPLRQHFDYLALPDLPSRDLPLGVRVTINFNHRELVGILVGVADHSTVPLSQLKAINAVIDEASLFLPTIWQLCYWISDYYHHPLGEVLPVALPTALRQGKALPKYQQEVARQPTSLTEVLLNLPLTLNPSQQHAVDSVLAARNQFQIFLVDGITGSGKTEVYLQIISQVIAQGKQALVLVPEIALTPQTIFRFTQRFKAKCVALHSGLTPRQSAIAWSQAKNNEAAIIIGTRSAIFTPLKNPGIIIVDEEHDGSYKQQDNLRYHARDVAIYRAKLENIPIVLGSATPSMESLYNARQGRYHSLQLLERAGDAQKPAIQLVDLRSQKLESGLSTTLLQAMNRHLERQEQVLLFLNRRGFAPVLMCHQCGQCVECPRCDAYLTVHQQPLRLLCHHCGSQRRMLEHCASCQAQQWLYVGLGTAKLEEVITQHFPGIDVIRFDSDTTRKKGTLQKLLETVEIGKPQILLGTQMLAKGHHFADVTLVAVLDADLGLFSSDFRATEHLGQLLVQVAGRSGRDQKPGTVMIQTHHPHHPLLTTLLYENYHAFADKLLQERQHAQLPPFTYLALFRAEALDWRLPQQFLVDLKQQLTPHLTTGLRLLGPIPPTRERVASRYRAQLLLIADQRQQRHQFLAKAIPIAKKLPEQRRLRWSIDIDPQEL